MQKYSTEKWFVKKSMTGRAMPGKKVKSEATRFFP
jgi:hypothetical protein